MVESSSGSDAEEAPVVDLFARKAGETPNYGQGFGKKRKLLSQPEGSENVLATDKVSAADQLLKCPYTNCGRSFATTP